MAVNANFSDFSVYSFANDVCHFNAKTTDLILTSKFHLRILQLAYRFLQLTLFCIEKKIQYAIILSMQKLMEVRYG